MADAATGVLTVAGAAIGSAAIQLTSDPFGVALASRFAGLTASYASVAAGVFSYSGATSLLAVAAGQGTVTVDGASASSALLVGDGTSVLYQGSGSASVATGSGNDTIVAGSGSVDTIAAGSGRNIVDVSAAASAYVDSFGSDQIRAGVGADTVMVDGAGTSSTVIGGTGSLVVENDGSAGTLVDVSSAVRFVGHGGTSTVAGGIDTLYGAADGVFTLDTTTHDNVFVANDPTVITGGAIAFDGSAASGGNEFWAGSGNATLIGGAGADTLAAGMGAATLTGGSGAANMFAFFAVQGSSATQATISDFAAASGNVIALFGYGQAGIEAALRSAVQVGANTDLTLTDGTKIVLAGTNVHAVTAADFMATNPKLG